jgi:hypothetical protein
VVRDDEDVVIHASCRQVFSLPGSDIAKALVMQNGLKLAKDVSFLNLIVESDASNVVLGLNVHQQFSTYVTSIE